MNCSTCRTPLSGPLLFRSESDYTHNRAVCPLCVDGDKTPAPVAAPAERTASAFVFERQPIVQTDDEDDTDEPAPREGGRWEQYQRHGKWLWRWVPDAAYI